MGGEWVWGYFSKKFPLTQNSLVSIQNFTHYSLLSFITSYMWTHIINISPTSHHHKEHKEHKMYVQFSFYYRLQSLGFISNNWIEYNSTRAQALYAILCLHSQHQLRWGNNPQQISICQQVRELSVVQHAYVRALPVVQLAYVRGQSVLQLVYHSWALMVFS